MPDFERDMSEYPDEIWCCCVGLFLVTRQYDVFSCCLWFRTMPTIHSRAKAQNPSTPELTTHHEIQYFYSLYLLLD